LGTFFARFGAARIESALGIPKSSLVTTGGSGQRAPNRRRSRFRCPPVAQRSVTRRSFALRRVARICNLPVVSANRSRNGAFVEGFRKSRPPDPASILIGKNSNDAKEGRDGAFQVPSATAGGYARR